ncbi:tRNA lysidine(34) synthetase TilS [Flexithrix dorotheae]|uniref:tRNA lysidine(34) synthetase TilS n=1 Tax=Flexithrix dorotheae TaxID=70993 RepID=UPI0003773AD6|nr:tRNA lysidine(34) synthetase TilS [Flexithrix dorotheae]
MIERFKNFIQSENLFQSEDKVLLAVSGGIDSMVLVDLFNQLDVSFGIAHCNFQLRGADSDGDEQLVKETAEDLLVPFYSVKFETEVYLKEKNISLQMAARELRYEWFIDLMQKENYKFLATAHHCNDGLETVLLNLTRGTGIEGMHGILPKSNHLIRPLLFASREEIKAYAEENDIEWREDSSNVSVKYKRNRIRHKVMPELKKINPSLEVSFQETLKKMSGVEAVFFKAIENWKNEVCEKKGDEIWISLGKLKSDPDLTIKLYYLLKNYSFNFRQITQIEKLIHEKAGKFISSITHQIIRDRKYFILAKKKEVNSFEKLISENSIEISIPGYELSLTRSDKSENTSFSKDKFLAQFDAELLAFPLKIRYWKSGDYFYPLGMKNRKKLSDFLIDIKMPIHRKNEVMVIESEGKIIWVLGERMDNRFKITEETKQITQIRLKPVS